MQKDSYVAMIAMIAMESGIQMDDQGAAPNCAHAGITWPPAARKTYNRGETAFQIIQATSTPPANDPTQTAVMTVLIKVMGW